MKEMHKNERRLDTNRANKTIHCQPINERDCKLAEQTANSIASHNYISRLIRRHGLDPTIAHIVCDNFDDPRTLWLIMTADTSDVFMLDSYWARDNLGWFQPREFKDIIAFLTIMEMTTDRYALIEGYTKGREHYAGPLFANATLQNIFYETYGILLYREQLFAIANTIAGYNTADLLVLLRSLRYADMPELVCNRIRFTEIGIKNGFSTEEVLRAYEILYTEGPRCRLRSYYTSQAMVAYFSAWVKATFVR